MHLSNFSQLRNVPHMPPIARSEHSQSPTKLASRAVVALLLKEVPVPGVVLVLVPFAAMAELVLVLVLDKVDVVVAVGISGANFSGSTEIAPAPKCTQSWPKTASVELTTSLRKDAE